VESLITAYERLRSFEPEWWAFYLIVTIISVLFLIRGFFRLRRLDEDGKRGGVLAALTWWLAAVAGLVLIVLVTITAGMKEVRGVPFAPWQQAIRISTLVMAFVFVVAVLVSLLPMLLNALEHWTFVSFVGARHIRATKSGFLTVISVLSVLGVYVSSCALCSVTSIMGGFGHDLKKKILGNTAHIVVDVKKPGGFQDWQAVLAEVRLAIDDTGARATPVVGGEAMASSSTNTAGTLMRGIDPETIGQVINLKANIEVGRWEYLLEPKRLIDLPAGEVIGRGPGGQPYFKGPQFRYSTDVDPELRDAISPYRKVYPGIIMGRELAKSLHVLVGDELTMLSPMGELGPTGIMPRARKFRVAGIFYSGMYEYDASHAYVIIDRGQHFFSLEERVTNIDIRVPEPEKVDEIRRRVDAAIAKINAAHKGHKDHQPLRVRDWKEMNRNLFSALKLEKIATFIILSIAITVASFCIICTLLLMVTEKAKEIAVLKSLGAAESAIMRVFMLEGIIIGAIGTISGVVGALVICLGLSWIGVRLDPDVYYIDRLPVNVDGGDYALVTLAALLICTLATVYPAYTAATVRPVDGLRYE